MVIAWHLFPFITGLMVTTVPERHALAVESVKDFLGQDWPHKELVIVNATELSFPRGQTIFEIRARSAENLWELGLAKCRGEWVADWQDDCRYSLRYLHALARLRARDKRVSLLGYGGICLADGTRVNVDNDGTCFSLAFRLCRVNGEPVWLDKRELVTRYDAAKLSA